MAEQRIPKMYVKKNKFDQEHIEDIRTLIEKQMYEMKASKVFREGMSIAIGVGSRGIECELEVLRSLIDFLLKNKIEPLLYQPWEVMVVEVLKVS